jgi:hypothetical protein
MERPPASPRTLARIAGVFYLLTFVTGIMAMASSQAAFAANLAATACYVAVTVLFYRLFQPVHLGLSLLAAIVSAVGLVLGLLKTLELVHVPVNNLVFFGGYCLLIGALIVRATFLPRVLGVLMMIGGLGWLTFASPALAKQLSPWNFAPGMIGEGALTVWLLVAGVNEQRWREQAAA